MHRPRTSDTNGAAQALHLPGEAQKVDRIMSKPATRSDILAGMATGGLAPAMAAIVTNPADVAKTRLNMARELKPGRVGSVVQCW